MNCPRCDHGVTRVLDSRVQQDGRQIRRKRECNRCTFRFRSLEIPEEREIQVIKRDGSIEMYRESKLRQGVMHSLVKRPVAPELVEQLIARVNSKVWDCSEALEARQLGAWVLEELKHLDAVAFVRFASVYRSFNSVDEFVDEIARI